MDDSERDIEIQVEAMRRYEAERTKRRRAITPRKIGWGIVVLLLLAVGLKMWMQHTEREAREFSERLEQIRKDSEDALWQERFGR